MRPRSTKSRRSTLLCCRTMYRSMLARCACAQKDSAGGQNGLKNIIYHLNSEDFPRVKIGVGKKPRPDYDLAAWVLGKFPAEDQKAIDKACEDAVNAAACIIAEDCAAAAQKFNGKRI